MQDYIVEPDLQLPHLTEHHRLFSVLPVIILNDHDCRHSGTHWHDYLQIFYTVSGAYRHRLNGEDLFPGEGTVILDFPYMTHQIDTSRSDMSRLKLFQISIRKDMWHKFRVPFLSHTYNTASFDGHLLPSRVLLTGETKAEADRLCAQLSAEYEKNSYMQPNRLMALVHSFLALLVRDVPKTVTPREENIARTRVQSIERTMEFVKKDLVRGVSLEEASKFAGMSRSSFTTVFRSVTGRTFHDYQNRLRMQKATNMLLRSSDSIAEIAKACGYYDSSHFRLVCTEMYGIAPHELRLLMSEYTRASNARYLCLAEKMRWTQRFDEDAMQRHQLAMSFY